jgi:peptidoglycan/xylan/chitin deacetylase (PgdA/CDA1 family)
LLLLYSEIVGCGAYKNERHANMESLYEYGSRAGFWRIRDCLVRANVPVTVYACGMALERNPEAGRSMIAAGWEVASHGYRWIDYQNVDEETEREHIRKTVQIHEDILGVRPVGIYQGSSSLYL